MSERDDLLDVIEAREATIRVQAEQIAALQEAMAYYAERRNHTTSRDGRPHLWTNDSFDEGGPGARARAALALAEGCAAPGVPLVKGPTTFTTACTCDSQLPGYHRMNCGVYALPASAPEEPE